MAGIPQSGCPTHEALKAYVDGELPVTDALPLREHLAGCAPCAEEVRIMRRIGEGLRDLAAVADTPATLREGVLSRLRFAPEGRRRIVPFDFLRLGIALGTAAVLAAVLMPVLTTGRYSAQQSAAVAPAPAAGAQAQRPARNMQIARGGEQPRNKGAEGYGGKRPQYTAPEEERFAQAWDDGHSKVQALPRAGAGAPGAPSDQNLYTTLDPPAASSAARPDISTNDIRKLVQGKPAEQFKRKVVQNADVGVTIKRPLEKVQDEIATRFKKQGGYVEESSLSAGENGARVAQMTLRVPVDTFEENLQYLTGLGEVTNKKLHGEDVTGRWIDERSEVRELRREEARLLKAYDKERDAWKRQEIQAQLFNVAKLRIPAAEERLAATTKLAALSTIHLTLTELPEARIRGGLLEDMENTTRSAVAAFLVALRVPAAILIWLAVFCPLWLPCLLAYRWATRMAERQRRALAEPAGAE